MDDAQAQGAKAAGCNVHRLRTSAGLSLADLAAAGGISKTTLHGIEQGEGNPTLSTLWALATALGVSLGELLEPPAAQPVAVTRASEGPRADGDAVHARLLHRIALRGTVEVYAVEIDPAEQASRAHLPGVTECMIVTGGAIRTGPADTPVDLAAGDSVHFGGAAPHIYRGLGPGSTAVLLMLHNTPLLPPGASVSASHARRVQRRLDKPDRSDSPVAPGSAQTGTGLGADGVTRRSSPRLRSARIRA